MFKIFKYAYVLGLLIGGFAFLWYYQPWSDYSPAKVAKLNDESRYGEIFRQMEAYLPARELIPGDNPRPLLRATRPMLTSFTVNGAEITPAEYHQDAATAGLVVLKDGVVVHESYYGGADSRSRHTSWSVAKSFVATAIMMAVREGKITSFDDMAETYAPQYRGTAFGQTTIRGLLHMASGIEFDEDYGKEGSDIRNFFFDAFIKRLDVDGLLMPYQRTRPEQSDFDYISPNTQVLSAVLRGAYDMKLADIISAKIWQPLGMADKALWNMHKPGEGGVAMGYCCLNASTADFARFGQFWLEVATNNDTGRGIGLNMLPENAADLVRLPASAAHKRDTSKYEGRGYSHHFWLPPTQPGGADEADGEVFMAVGVYGQYIWVDSKRNIVIARNAADLDWDGSAPKTFAFFRAIARHYASD